MRNQINCRRLHQYLVAIVVCAVVLAPVSVFAHPGHDHGPAKVHGFINGLQHPLTGLDHCCAMIAIGVWAAQLGGRATWSVPVTFLSLMTVGGVLGGFLTPMVHLDQSIAASALVVGLLISFASRLPVMVSQGITGLFAVFHGYVHIVEMPRSTLTGPYGVGILITSSLLLATGFFAAQLLIRAGQMPAVRWSGAAISLFSLFLCFR